MDWREAMSIMKLQTRGNRAPSGLLGYATIEVLAIEPWALSTPGHAELGDWAQAGVSCLYICEVDGCDLIRIVSEDLWTDIAEGIYGRVEEFTDKGAPEAREDRHND
jgi:hypothetical protein